MSGRVKIDLTTAEARALSHAAGLAADDTESMGWTKREIEAYWRAVEKLNAAIRSGS